METFSTDEMFDKDTLVRVAFDSSLLMIKHLYEKSNPGCSGNFTAFVFCSCLCMSTATDAMNRSQNVFFHAHVTKTGPAPNLNVAVLENKTMEELLQYFADLDYITAQNVATRKLSIRLVIKEQFLVCFVCSL